MARRYHKKQILKKRAGTVVAAIIIHDEGIFTITPTLVHAAALRYMTTARLVLVLPSLLSDAATRGRTRSLYLPLLRLSGAEFGQRRIVLP